MKNTYITIGLLLTLSTAVVISIVGATWSYIFFTSELFDGISDFEKYRIAGFKLGFFIGVACSLITSFGVCGVFSILKNKTITCEK